MDRLSRITLFNFVLKCSGDATPAFSPKTALNMRFTHHDMTFDLAEMAVVEDNADGMYALNIAVTLLQATGLLTMTISQALDDDNEIKLGMTSLDLEHLQDGNKDGLEEHAYDLIMDSGDLPSLQLVLMAAPPPVALDLVQCSHTQHIKRFLVVETCSEYTTDAEFIRYGAELKELAQKQHVLLVMQQFLKLRDRCLAVANVHDRLSIIIIFAELLDEQFRLEGSADPQTYMCSRYLYQDFAVALWTQTDFDPFHLLEFLPDTIATSTSMCLLSFGMLLLPSLRFGHPDDKKKLDHVIAGLERAEQIPLPPFPLDQFLLYTSLCDVYHHRYRQSNAVSDLDLSLIAGSKALALQVPWWDYPDQEARALGSIARLLEERYTRVKDTNDLKRAMECALEAVELAEEDGEARVLCLMTQASIYSTRHHYLDQLDDLDQCIKIREELVATVDASHPMVPIIRQHLAASLSNRFDHIAAQLPSWSNLNATDKERDLFKQAASDVVAKQLELLEKLIDTDPGNPHMDHFQVSLATTLLARGGLMGKRKADVVDKNDLDEAIRLLLLASSKTDDTNAATSCGADQGHAVQMLGQALYARYILFGRNTEDFQASVSVLSKATNSLTLPPNQRLYAATSLFQFLLEENSDTGRHVSACLDALAAMMRLLPSTVWIGMSMQDRHNALTIPATLRFGRLETPLLKSIAHIPSRAASFAISNGELTRAVEWLEQGRSIVWHQLLQFRSPLTEDVKREDADLAERLSNLAGGLAISSTRAHSRSEEAEASVKSDVEALKHRKLVEEWESALEDGRNLPGLEKLFLPKDYAYLSRAASHGIVVIINIDLCDCQCDALVMYPGGEAPLRVPLRGGITFQDAERMQRDFLSLVQDDFGLRDESESARKVIRESPAVDEQEQIAMFKQILSELWLKIVGPILRALVDHRPGLVDANPSKRREHIHWCLTGPLAFLPLHAAGDYTKSEHGYKVYDYVISSYIPTLDSILRGNDTAVSFEPKVMDRTTVTKPKVLTVACPNAGGYQYIPATKDEVQLIEKQVTPASLEFTVLKDRDATASRVLNELKTANWVHFACHGIQNIESPTQSALLLAEGSRLSLSDIAAIDLPRAEMAFLSACQTATGYDKLPSESIHLAAGMLLAGYRSVVATMWSISDREAPRVADDFYGYMLRGEKRGRPDYRESAEALHVAVEKLRKRVGEDKFLSWVSYIHFGV